MELKEYKPSRLPIWSINLQASLRFEAMTEGCMVLREGCSEKASRGSSSKDDDTSLIKTDQK